MQKPSDIRTAFCYYLSSAFDSSRDSPWYPADIFFNLLNLIHYLGGRGFLLFCSPEIIFCSAEFSFVHEYLAHLQVGGSGIFFVGQSRPDRFAYILLRLFHIILLHVNGAQLKISCAFCFFHGNAQADALLHHDFRRIIVLFEQGQVGFQKIIDAANGF